MRGSTRHATSAPRRSIALRSARPATGRSAARAPERAAPAAVARAARALDRLRSRARLGDGAAGPVRRVSDGVPAVRSDREERAVARWLASAASDRPRGERAARARLTRLLTLAADHHEQTAFASVREDPSALGQHVV